MNKYFLNHRNEWIQIDNEKDIFVPMNHKLSSIELFNNNLKSIGLGYFITK